RPTAMAGGWIKWLPAGTTPERVVTVVLAVLATIVTAVALVIRHVLGDAAAAAFGAAIVLVMVRWVYWNGVGVVGWRWSWLRNANDQLRAHLVSEPQQEGTLRFVCISDTHSKHRNVQVPAGDVLLHCGDFTQKGTHEEVRDFNDWLGTLPHKHKLVIAGNHDLSLDPTEWENKWRGGPSQDAFIARSLLTNCTYVENRSVIIDGIKVFGSPMTPPIPGRTMAFNVNRGFAAQQHWSKIPSDVDVLMTHGPPNGVLDKTVTGLRVGEESLLKEIISRCRPKFHVFGHIHEAYGVTRLGSTVFINCATNTLLGKPKHLPTAMSAIAGPLYRRSPRLFSSKNKPGDWTLVWCELPLERGELLVFQEQHGRRLAKIPVRECDIAHVRSDGRDCVEITLRKAGNKKETFSSQESSYDVDWWMHTLLSVKRDLERGVRPRISLVCSPAQEPPTRQKAVRRQPSAATAVMRPTLRRRQPTLDASVTLFERFTIYETTNVYYVVCSDRHYSRFRMIGLNRTLERPQKLSEILVEDERLYTWDEMEERLQVLSEKAKAEGQGRFTRAFTAVAIVGCIRFLRGYYFIFVTQRRKIGCIGGNFIYGIQATQQLSVSRPAQGDGAWSWINRWLNPSPEEEAEARYLGLFHFIDLTKDFYFSYSYDITHTLQHNMTTEKAEPAEMFTWNYYLTQELKATLSNGAASDLVIPIVLGCYEQRKCSVFGRLISIILLARRSRHFAGTRYLKRGVADTGKAANDVETEQIIEDENMGAGKFSSFVQYRGSIPVFWSQETSATLPKPPIVLNRVDPTYTATRKHFSDLFARYGSPIVALNLVKQTEKKEREVIVGNEYMNSVEYLNSFIPAQHRIRYIALDYSRLSKQKGLNVLHSLDKVATGFFCSAPKRQVGRNDHKRSVKVQRKSPKIVYNSKKALNSLDPPPSPTIPRNSGDWLEQKGVLRTNCIDCLDRTNVSQFSVGMRALGQQLYAMGIRNTPLLESRSQLVRVLMLLYSLVGDAISMQYGGSEAHKNVKNSAGRENVKHRELLTSIRRYYSNSFTDMAKQDAINIFLGHFVPKEFEPPLWELESDYYLHNFEVRDATHGQDLARKEADAHGERLVAVTETACDEHGTVVQTTRAAMSAEDRKRREEYVQECKKALEDWWKQPLEEFERPKFYMATRDRLKKKSQRSLDKENYPDSTISDASPSKEKVVVSSKKNGMPYSDGFAQMYHPEELTSFDKALGYKFMNPMDLSNESNDVDDPTAQRSASPAIPQVSSSVAHTDSSNVEALPPSSRRVSSRGGITNRAGRSMSAPDIVEEVDRPEPHRRTRENSSREYKPEHDEHKISSQNSTSSIFSSIMGNLDVRSNTSVDSSGTRSTRAAMMDSTSANRAFAHQQGSQQTLSKGASKRKDEPLSIEDYVQNRGHRKFIGDCATPTPDGIYERYVHWNQSPSLWETDNESVKMYFEAYLRDHRISADDVRSVRDAQVRGGATFKIQAGPYAGLDQNVKARVLVTKKLKTDPEDRKIFEDSVDYKKLVTMGKSSVPAESLELYKSFFDEDLPDVLIYKPSGSSPTKQTAASGSQHQSAVSVATLQLAEDFRKMTLFKRHPGGRGAYHRGNHDLISVGPLFKLDGGKDKDFILFNESAADNHFCEVIKNETELSFYTK
ncbi:TPA: hypothetical protein N0F65_005252, partial [Lagenidium giganteum]